MIHNDDSRLSFIVSIQPRVYTICLPSGEIRGSETVSNSRYMSRVNRSVVSATRTNVGTHASSSAITHLRIEPPERPT
jgi:hypothetical protein